MPTPNNNLTALLKKAGKDRNKRQKALPSGKFYTSSVEVKADEVVIRFPKEIIDYLGLDPSDLKVFWAPINGVVQVSGTQPSMVIPMISVGLEQFLPDKR